MYLATMLSGNPQPLCNLRLGQAFDAVQQQRLAGIVGQFQQRIVKNLQALPGPATSPRVRRRA